MTPATAFLRRLHGLTEPEVEAAFAAEIAHEGGNLTGGEPVKLSLHGIMVGAPSAGEALRKWMKVATYREFIDSDLALAERCLHQPGTDRATLTWACGTILQHAQDAWLRTAAEQAMPKAERAA